MQCLYLAGTTTECLLRRGVRLWEFKYAVFVCVGATPIRFPLVRSDHLWGMSVWGAGVVQW